MKKRELKDKIAGAVYGFMVGDAMGATTEFLGKEQIEKLYAGGVRNIVGGGVLQWEAGDCTDDTQLTSCVMDALYYSQSSLPSMRPSRFKFLVAEEFANWLAQGPRDVGNACRAGIRRFMCGGFIDRDDSLLGNGALMRAMPCALIGRDDLNQAQAEVTHFNDTQSEVIRAYSSVLRAYVMGEYPYGNLTSLRSRLDVPEGLVEPTGHVINTFCNALYWSSKSTFEQCVIGAVNDGGDADTIAAIAGSLAGARFGLNGIPGKWVAKLKLGWRIQAGSFINFVVESNPPVYNVRQI